MYSFYNGIGDLTLEDLQLNFDDYNRGRPILRKKPLIVGTPGSLASHTTVRYATDSSWTADQPRVADAVGTPSGHPESPDPEVGTRVPSRQTFRISRANTDNMDEYGRPSINQKSAQMLSMTGASSREFNSYLQITSSWPSCAPIILTTAASPLEARDTSLLTTAQLFNGWMNV